MGSTLAGALPDYSGRAAAFARFALPLVAAIVLSLSVGATLAGELTGSGKSLEPLHANSICAFNGLNDYDSLEGQNDFHVQSYGVDVAGKKVTSEPADPHVFNPGDACRGNG